MPVLISIHAKPSKPVEYDLHDMLASIEAALWMYLRCVSTSVTHLLRDSKPNTTTIHAVAQQHAQCYSENFAVVRYIPADLRRRGVGMGKSTDRRKFILVKPKLISPHASHFAGGKHAFLCMSNQLASLGHEVRQKINLCKHIIGIWAYSLMFPADWYSWNCKCTPWYTAWSERTILCHPQLSTSFLFPLIWTVCFVHAA